MHASRRRAAFVFLAGLAAAAPAQEESEEVLVTAARRQQRLSELPYRIDLLDAGDLTSERLPRTLPDALREFPGVMVQKTSQGQASPYVRGFTGYHTLLMIDGIRLNNSVFRSGPNQYWGTVDPWSLERLELVKGPASVLYGSDAVGGAALAWTPRLESGGPGLTWERRLALRLASAERSWIARGEVRGSLDESWRFLAGATWKEFGELQAGPDTGTWPKTGYEEGAADLKLEHHFHQDAYLSLAYQRVRQDDAWRAHKTLYGKSWRSTTVGNERRRSLSQERDLAYLQYHARDLEEWLTGLEASLSWHAQREGQRRTKANGSGDRTGFEVDTLGAWIQGESDGSAGLWTYGLELYHDLVDSYGRRTDSSGLFTGGDLQGPVGDDAAYTLLGLFVQDELGLGEGWAAALGARWTWARARADEVADPDTGNRITVKDSYQALVGSVRLLWRPFQERALSLFGGVSQAFRAPNLSDLTRLDEARSNEIETPSPGLDPEYFLTYELGLRLDTDALRGELALFYTDIRDMIVPAPTGRVVSGLVEVTKRNAGDGRVFGLDGRLSWTFLEGLALFGSGAWLYGEARSYPTSDPVRKTEPLSRLMPPSATCGLRWEAGPGRPWAELAATLAGKADELNRRDRQDTQRIPPGGTPAYQILALRGGWEFRPGWEVSGALENLTHRDYRIHGSGQNEPGFNALLGLDVRF